MSHPRKVFVFGGTHGNEWTGVKVVEEYAAFFKKKFPTLDLHFIFANPEGHAVNKRFKDEDLNRAFQFLHEDRAHSFEHNRARELKNLIDKEPCFVIDLHTTTSNMGLTLILTHLNEANYYLSEVCSKTVPECRIISSPDPHKKYLASQSEYGLMVEVGPVANSVVDARVLEGTLTLLDKIFSTLASGEILKPTELEIYEEIQDISYPKEASGKISAYIHSDFQGKDFQRLQGKYTPFMSFHGEPIHSLAQEELYPIFINEAAYYPQALAFTLCRKKVLQFDA